MSRTGPLTKDTSTIALGLAQIRVGAALANIATITSVLPAASSIGALASTKYTGTVDYWKLVSGFPQLEDLTLPLSEASMLECEFKEMTPYNMALARGIDPVGAVAAGISLGDSYTVAGTTDVAGVGAISVSDDAGPITDMFTCVFTAATTYDVYSATEGKLGTSGTVSVLFEPDNGGLPYFSVPADYFTGTWAADEVFTFSTTAYAAAGAYSDAHVGSINLGALSAPAFVRMEAVYTYPNGTSHMYIIFPRANAVSTTEIDLQAEDNANIPITFEAKRADSGVTGGHSAWDSASLGRIYFD
jgi:hypothetical protein